VSPATLTALSLTAQSGIDAGGTWRTDRRPAESVCRSPLPARGLGERNRSKTISIRGRLDGQFRSGKATGSRDSLLGVPEGTDPGYKTLLAAWEKEKAAWEKEKARYDTVFDAATRRYETDLADWQWDKNKWCPEWCAACGYAKSPLERPMYEPPAAPLLPRTPGFGGSRRHDWGDDDWGDRAVVRRVGGLRFSTMPDAEAPVRPGAVSTGPWWRWKSQESQPRPQWCRGCAPVDLHRSVTGIGELEDSNRPTGNIPAGAGLAWTPEQQKRMGMTRSKRPVVRVARTASIADEIRNLSALRDEGVITESEFQSLKRRLIEGG
jgi:hypothetical protein